MNHKYIRLRKNNKYQARIYSDDKRFSFTSKDLNEVVEKRNKELGYDPDKADDTNPKILLIDIETTPILAWVWGLWNQNIQPTQIKEDWYVLCFAYKWLGQDEINVYRLFDTKEGNRDGEKRLVSKLYELLDTADIVVAHNGDKFDIKKINAKFLEYGFKRPSPYRTIDTLKMARRNFSITSNKLDYLSKFLGGDGKRKHGGFSLWIDCMNGVEDAWDVMSDYNIIDIRELERVYLALRGWGGHPNLNLYSDDTEFTCPTCMSTNIAEIRPTLNNNNSYRSFKCNNCGAAMREKSSMKSAKIAGVL